MSESDVIVLGAGIVGASCAMECAHAGMKVTLVEAGVIGAGATAAGMGHIVVMDDSPAQLALTQFSQQLWQALAPKLPDDVEYSDTGTIWVAADDLEMKEVARKAALYQEHGLSVRILDRRELLCEEPHLDPLLAGGLLVSSDAVLYPPRAAYYLLQQALHAGAVLIRQTVTGAAKGVVQLANGESLRAPRIVNALGTAAASITPDLPIRQRKGHLVITDRAPGFVRHQLVELGYIRSAGSGAADSVAFNAQPRKTGQVLIGSSRQYDSPDSTVDHNILERMMQRTLRYLPDIGCLPVLRVWTGVRAATPDKLPLIGPHPDDPTLFLATGHEGLGITTALGTGRLLRHILTGSEAEIPIEPYLPARVFLASSEASHA